MLLFKTSLSISHGKFYDKCTVTINSKVIVPSWNDEFELPDNSQKWRCNKQLTG